MVALTDHEATDVGPSAPVEHEEGFVYHLLALHVAERTGVMTVRMDQGTVDIYLRGGTPVFAERNTLGGSLSLDLLKTGAITSEQYEAVVSHMTRDLFESEQMRFAEVAVELGFLSHEQVNVALEEQVRLTVVECMASREAEITFRTNPDALGPVANYPCPVQPLVLSGVKQYYDWERAEGVWQPDAGAFAKLKLSPAETAALYALKPDERRYISAIDGTKSVRELIKASGLGELHSSQLIASLLLTEGIELYSEPPPAPQASEPEPRANVESASTRRRMSSPLLAAVRPTLPVTVRLSERPKAASASVMPKAPIAPLAPLAPTAPAAPAVLGAPLLATGVPKRSVPIEVGAPEAPGSREQRRVNANKLFVQGKRLLKSDALKGASRSFAMAERLEPESVEYALYAKWTEFLSHPPQNAEAAFETLSRLALAAIKQDKHHAYAYYVFGRVAHARGDTEAARVAMKHASKLDPTNTEAKTFLRVLSK